MTLLSHVPCFAELCAGLGPAPAAPAAPVVPVVPVVPGAHLNLITHLTLSGSHTKWILEVKCSTTLEAFRTWTSAFHELTLTQLQFPELSGLNRPANSTATHPRSAGIVIPRYSHSFSFNRFKMLVMWWAEAAARTKISLMLTEINALSYLLSKPALSYVTVSDSKFFSNTKGKSNVYIKERLNGCRKTRSRHGGLELETEAAVQMK